MIETKTLLIVGAGASVPYGYPTGYELRSELTSSNALSGLQQQIDKSGLELFCRHFEESQLNSIDAFLAKRGDDKVISYEGHQRIECATYGEYGKLAIAHILIEREEVTNLIKPKDDHWLQYLWNLMSDVPKSEFQNNQLKIVSFNYDRVIEQYFQTTIQHSYGVEYAEGLDLRSAIEIIHVYGSLGNLENRAYGIKLTNVKSAANSILVIPEAREENNTEFEKAKQIIQWADKICFIGFGFDSTNMRRLGFPHHDLSAKKIYGSTYSSSYPEIKFSQKSTGKDFEHLDANAKTLGYLRGSGLFLDY